MEPVSAASGIAGLIAVAFKTIQLVTEYVNLAHEHKKHAEMLNKELLLLKEVLDQLKNFINEEKRNGRMMTVNDEDRNTVLGRAFAHCTSTIEEIQDKLKEPLSRFKKAMAKLKWPFEQKEVLRLVDNLRRYTQLFQLSLTVSNCDLLSKTFDVASEGLKSQREKSKEIQRLCEGIPHIAKAAEETLAQTETLLKLVPTFLQEVSLGIREIGLAQRLAEQREQDWLCPITALQKHSDINARRAPGTGDWFLERDEISSWLSPDSDCHEVLCLGDPGAGKTNLASLIVDRALHLRPNHDVAIVHFYCDYREQRAQTPAHCASNMLRQLSTQCNAMPVAVSEFYQRTRNDVKDQSWYIELRKILCRVASTFSRCFFVIDALDEAEAGSHMHGLLDLLRSLRSGISSRMPKIFATSRKYASAIQESFREAIKVTVAANNKDLRTILAKIIADHHDSKYFLDDQLKEDILGTLCTGAQGMYVRPNPVLQHIFTEKLTKAFSIRFLLPVLQLQYVLSQLTKSEVRRALRDRSANLTDVFDSTIERIRSLPESQRHAMNRRNLAIKTLMWISHVKRVLSVVELQHVLAVRPEDSELDRENFVEPQLIVDSCFGLVEIDEKSSTIRFVHYSLQEYLRSHEHGLFEKSDVEITKVCLKYLSLDSTKDLHVKNRQSFLKALEELSFLDYAATQWGYHAASVSPDDVKDVALKFLKDSSHLLTAARVRDHGSPYFRKWHERMYAWAFSDGAGISVCASFGLTEFLSLLIGQYKEPMLEAKNMYGSTALHEAALRGYQSTAQLLLAHGADVLVNNTGKSTPLYLAVANSQIAIARLLLQRDARAQLDKTGNGRWTVLHKAADLGNEEMVVLLLQNGAMVNAEDEKGMTALHLAARKGYAEVVRLLLVSDAEVHPRGADQVLTPLDQAVTGGHLEVTRMLLNNGAQIEHRGPDKWTALHRAARGGHEHVIALLLQSGANLLIEDHKGQIPLHAAARSGNARAVELLLKEKPGSKKDQLFKKERTGSTPRDVAFFTAHYEIHKLLRAAEIEGQEHHLSTVDKITSAIESGKKEKVGRLLADKSVDIDGLIDGRQPALHLAMQEEQIEIVKILLHHGANINTIGYHGWTALHIAASVGNLTLTELCLSQGADVQTLTDTAQTALHKACSSKNIQVVKALLAAGSDREAMNERGMRPLHIAAHQNNMDMIRLLIQDYNVSITPKDKFGDTAAMWAERSGHLAVSYYLRSEEKRLRKMQGAALS